MTAPLNLPSLRKVAEEAHVKPHTVPIEEGVRRFQAYVATFDPPTVLALLALAEHKERLEGALEHAAGLIEAAAIRMDHLRQPEAARALEAEARDIRAALSPELPDGDAT